MAGHRCRRRCRQRVARLGSARNPRAQCSEVGLRTHAQARRGNPKRRRPASLGRRQSRARGAMMDAAVSKREDWREQTLAVYGPSIEGVALEG